MSADARPDTTDLRDNAGPWTHDDGTHCPTYWASKPLSSQGQPWWCTEHQQHVHSAAYPDPTPEPDRTWPECATYPNLGCVCRGGLQSSKSTCTRKRTGDLTPIRNVSLAPDPTPEPSWAEVAAKVEMEQPPPFAPTNMGCDCTELCSMGPTRPGAMAAGLPGSGCWRATPEPDEDRAPTPYDPTDADEAEFLGLPEPDAGDVETLALLLWEAERTGRSSIYASTYAEETPTYRNIAETQAGAILASDWLANQRRLAREQGRAEGGAGWAAVVEGLADEWDRTPRHNGSAAAQAVALTAELRALTADRTKALDAVKAQAWDEGQKAGMQNHSAYQNTGHPAHLNPYRADRIGGPS